jgi:hypothetical protein
MRFPSGSIGDLENPEEGSLGGFQEIGEDVV